MQRTLEAFVGALRGSGVPVSVREGIEAAEAVALVGYDSREVLRDALAVVLAKSAAEKARFDTCFELFFSRGEPGVAAAGVGSQDPSETLPPLAQVVLQGDAAAIAAAMEGAAAQAGVGGVRYVTQRGFFARRMLDLMGLRELEAAIAALQAQGEISSAGTAQALERGRSRLLRDAQAYVERQYRLRGPGEAERLQDELLADASLSALDARDTAAMRRIVRRLARRLADRHSRRRRRARRGQLDARRTLARNARHDFVPFELAWRQRRRQQPKVVALCDVSRSVAAVARFLLLFLYSLNEAIPHLRAYAFSDRLVPVGEDLDADSAEAATVAVLRRIGFRPTDYGQALADFADTHLAEVDRHTTVVILGDARSNHTDPRPELLKQIAGRARRVVWLNPEPRAFWGSGDSEMPRYAPYCSLARPCSTVRHLERAVDDILKGYD